MSPKYILLQALSILFFVKTGFTQSTNFIAGPELQGTNRPMDIYLHDNEVSFFAGDVASGAMGKKDLNFFRLDKNTLAPTLNKTNLTQLKYADYTLENIFSFPEKEFVLYSSDHVNDNIILNYQLIDNASKGPFEMTSINMGKKKYPKDKPAKSFFGYNTYEALYNNYHLFLSPNKEKFLYIDNIPLVNHQNPDRVPEARLVLMNTKDMKVEKELAFDLGILNFGYGVLFGDNNFAYSLVKVRQEENNDQNYFYKILGLSLKEGVPSFEYDVKFPGKTIETIKIEIAPNGDIICGGGYIEIREKRKPKCIDGIFYARIHPETGKLIAENISNLDAKIATYLGGTLSGSKLDGVKTEFTFTNFVTFENGSINMLLEERSYNDKGSYYGSILVANLQSTGKLNWMQSIPKLQILDDGCNDSFWSFSHKVNGNSLSMVFTDDKDNYDENTKQVLEQFKSSNKKLQKATRKGATVAIATINEKGDVNQKILSETGKHTVYSQGAVWNKAGDEIYFIAKKSGGKHCIAKVKLK